MSVQSGQTITRTFTTVHPATNTATDADTLPTAVLRIDGTDDAAAVTVTALAGAGDYTFSVTLPTKAAGACAEVIVSATVAGVADRRVVWRDTYDKAVNALNDIAAGAAMTLTAAYDKAKDDVLTPLAAAQADIDSILTNTSETLPLYFSVVDAKQDGAQADIDTIAAKVAHLPDATAGTTNGLALKGDVAVTVEPTPVTVNPTLTEAQAATLDAIKAKTDTLHGTATGTYTLEFRLLLDSNGDGVADVPNVGISGVRCRVFDATGTTKLREDATTDDLGWVRWYGFAAGTYKVDPDHPQYRASAVSVTLPES